MLAELLSVSPGEDLVVHRNESVRSELARGTILLEACIPLLNISLLMMFTIFRMYYLDSLLVKVSILREKLQRILSQLILACLVPHT